MKRSIISAIAFIPRGLFNLAWSFPSDWYANWKRNDKTMGTYIERLRGQTIVYYEDGTTSRDYDAEGNYMPLDLGR